MIVMSAMAPYLVFSVGMGAAGGYRIARRGLHIHRYKVGGDAVGNRILWWKCGIVGNAFSEIAADRDAAWQRRHERDISCDESLFCTG